MSTIQRHFVSYDPATGAVIQQAHGPTPPDIEGLLTVEVDSPLSTGPWHWNGADFSRGRVPVSLEEARSRQWAAIKAQRDILDGAPIGHNDYQLDADQNSRMDIMGAVLAMQTSGLASRQWRCSDNVMRELTLTDLVAVGQAIAARRQSLIETSSALWQQIQAAQTVEAVEAVGWPAG